MEAMATKMRRQNAPIIQTLSNDICRFDFYQAVHLLETLCQQETGNKNHFPIRFAANTSLSFYASPIASLQGSAADESTLDMLVNFFGLSGFDAPMPYEYIEQINQQERRYSGPSALRAFLDLINHHLIKLRYDLRKCVRTGFQPGVSRNDSLHQILHNLLGLVSDQQTNQAPPLPDTALLRYTALLHGQRRSLQGLELILSDFFGTAIDCQPLTGGWQPLPPTEQNRLGANGRHQRLGNSLTLGAHVRDVQSRFTITIQAHDWACFEQFLPLKQADYFQQMAALIAFYTQNQFDYNCILSIATEKIPHAPENPRLSWSCLLDKMPPGTRYLEVPLSTRQIRAAYQQNHSD